MSEAVPAAEQAVVQVEAFSLNRGEVRMTLTRSVTVPGISARDWRPGWDVAGVVAQAAADGSGPPVGTRVVGLVPSAGWAQRVAVSTSSLSPLPEGLRVVAAATLPVAGLTALRMLRRGGLLLGRRVLVTGAAGGVGRYALQLAARAGARVTAVVGSPQRGQGLRELGAHEVITTIDASTPTFDLALESVGGTSLAAAMNAAVVGGLVVTFGSSSGEETTFDVRRFYNKNRATLQGFSLFTDLATLPPTAAEDLGYLAGLMARGELAPQIDFEMSWREAGRAMTTLMDRQVAGKAVLRVD